MRNDSVEKRCRRCGRLLTHRYRAVDPDLRHERDNLDLNKSTANSVWADSSNSTGDNPNGTAAFDTYTDKYSLGLFSDGFESNNTSAWSATVP